MRTGLIIPLSLLGDGARAYNPAAMTAKEKGIAIVSRFDTLLNEIAAMRVILDSLKISSNGQTIDWRVWMRQQLEDPLTRGVASEKCAQIEQSVREAQDDPILILDLISSL